MTYRLEDRAQTTSEEKATFTAACRELLGSPDQWRTPTGYPQSVALCIINSIQSTGPRFTSVLNVVDRYRSYRASQGADAEVDGVLALIDSFSDLDGVEGWAAQIGNQHRTYQKKTAPLKAQAILQAATKLASQGIDSMQDLQGALGDDARRTSLKASWLDVVSQSSGITWDYFLMLVGEDGVKADRMVKRYVERVLVKKPGSVSSDFAKTVVTEGAAGLGVTVSNLDHVIWRFESGRG